MVAHSTSVEDVLVISREHRYRARSQSSAGTGMTFPQPLIAFRLHYTAPRAERSRRPPAVKLSGWIDTCNEAICLTYLITAGGRNSTNKGCVHGCAAASYSVLTRHTGQKLFASSSALQGLL